MGVLLPMARVVTETANVVRNMTNTRGNWRIYLFIDLNLKRFYFKLKLETFLKLAIYTLILSGAGNAINLAFFSQWSTAKGNCASIAVSTIQQIFQH
jgi:hypothetical protein